MGSLRHKDPLLCTQGALAQLLFWRWHVAGEPAPPFAAARIGTESRSSLARTARASSLAAHSCKRPGVSLELLA